MSIIPFINRVNEYILNPIILLLFGLSTVYFIYGIIRYLSTDAGDKSSARVEARSSILWGIFGMVIMVSVYGIIGFILATFGLSVNDVPPTAGQFLNQ